MAVTKVGWVEKSQLQILHLTNTRVLNERGREFGDKSGLPFSSRTMSDGAQVGGVTALSALTETKSPFPILVYMAFRRIQEKDRLLFLRFHLSRHMLRHPTLFVSLCCM